MAMNKKVPSKNIRNWTLSILFSLIVVIIIGGLWLINIKKQRYTIDAVPQSNYGVIYEKKQCDSLELANLVDKATKLYLDGRVSQLIIAMPYDNQAKLRQMLNESGYDKEVALNMIPYGLNKTLYTIGDIFGYSHTTYTVISLKRSLKYIPYM